MFDGSVDLEMGRLDLKIESKNEIRHYFMLTIMSENISKIKKIIFPDFEIICK